MSSDTHMLVATCKKTPNPNIGLTNSANLGWYTLHSFPKVVARRQFPPKVYSLFYTVITPKIEVACFIQEYISVYIYLGL